MGTTDVTSAGIERILDPLFSDGGLSYIDDAEPVLGLLCACPEAITRDMAARLLADASPQWEAVLSRISPLLVRDGRKRIQLRRDVVRLLLGADATPYAINTPQAARRMADLLWKNLRDEIDGERHIPGVSRNWLPHFVRLTPSWQTDPSSLDEYADYLDGKDNLGQALRMRCRAHELRYACGEQPDPQRTWKVFETARRGAFSTAREEFVSRYADPDGMADPSLRRDMRALAMIERIHKTGAFSDADSLVPDSLNDASDPIRATYLIDAALLLTMAGDLSSARSLCEAVSLKLPDDHYLCVNALSLLAMMEAISGNLAAAETAIDTVSATRKDAARNPMLRLAIAVSRLLCLRFQEASDECDLILRDGKTLSSDPVITLARFAAAAAKIMLFRKDAMEAASSLIARSSRIRCPWGFALGEIAMGATLSQMDASGGSKLLRKGGESLRRMRMAFPASIALALVVTSTDRDSSDRVVEPGCDAMAWWENVWLSWRSDEEDAELFSRFQDPEYARSTFRAMRQRSQARSDS